MDFEVLGDDPSHPHFFQALESYFKDRRRQLQDWDAAPPHYLGVAVLLMGVVEVIFSWRLSNGAGFSRQIVAKGLMAALAVLLAELAIARIGSEVAGFFNKKGKVGTAVTFFNLGLLPLFVVLPLAVAGYARPQLRPWILIGDLFLLTRILGNWRESLEVCFELSKLQSALVLYLTGGLFVLLTVFGLYIGLISSLTQIFS
jgi:hypothetical protein